MSKEIKFNPTGADLARYTGATLQVQPTNASAFSFTLAETSWGNHFLIRVIAQTLGIDEAAWPISAVSAEKSGGAWYLSIHTKKLDALPSSIRYHASAILINGMYLDHYLEAVGPKGI